MKKIVIQAGHQNIQYNSIVALHGSTGAPNEMAFNIDIANQVSAELRNRGFEVKQTDANANSDTAITSTDWDAFYAIHYDSDSYGTGGFFTDYPEPSTDGSTLESQRIAKVLAEEYGKVTGIIQHKERSNANTRYFYMWKYLSAKTPCCLIECGVGMHVPDDWQILHFDRSRVVEGITRGICKTFNVQYDTTPPLPPPPATPSECDIALSKCNTQLSANNNLIKQAKEILYGKGFIWNKLSRLKVLLPNG